MSSLLTTSDLTHELDIVWLEDPAPLDYVRQTLDKTKRRNTKPPYLRDGRMVGYAILGTDAEADPDSGLYRRRVFYLLPHDRDTDPDGVYTEGAPGEAIDPRTVSAKDPGTKTSRSQGADTAAPA